MTDDEATAHLLEQLEIYRRNLQHLLDQAARFNGVPETPLPLYNDIINARTHIHNLKKNLRTRNIPVTDYQFEEDLGLTQLGSINPGVLSRYLEVFVHTNRSPSWDEDLCSIERINRSQIHYAPVIHTEPPAFRGNLDIIDKFGLSVELETLPSFFKQISNWKKGLRGERKNVFVLLGDPGTGKSSLAVQLARFVAYRRQEDLESPIPVYINLFHFDNSYTPDVDGLNALVKHSIEQACPRYILQESNEQVNKVIGVSEDFFLMNTRMSYISLIVWMKCHQISIMKG